MDAHLREMLDLLLRWSHLVAGILWIGNSMLWNWLDRNLTPGDAADPLHEGTIWLVHSGGFYEMKKRQLEPHQLPPQLHWFWLQATTTWLTGVALLVVVYYMGGRAALVDTEIAPWSQGQAIALSVGLLVGCWLVYDVLWRSPLAQRPRLAAAVSLLLLAALAYGLTRTFNGQAAFLHLGAILGTLMVSNVWQHILPSQRELVRLTRAGERQELALAKAAKQRSIHNNYMTYPVLFTMLSGHFPSTYGGPHAWLVLLLLVLSGALVRHLMNLRFQWPAWRYALAATLAIALPLLYWLTRPAPLPATSGAPVAYAQVRAILQARCSECHATHPRHPAFATAAAGLALEDPTQVQAAASRIRAQAVDTRAMPPGNATGISEQERAILGAWIAQGARLNAP
ncbi:MAG: urate hydroxylase PuuD [Candidatus Sericytochromatia bacterium]|nr:urate hydroxylase PuuD [Candidatus Sericytochromatia bacterium]